MTLELNLFGGFDARLMETGALLRLPTRKCEAALTYLCVHPRHAVRRDALISLLWSDVPHAQGRHSLRQTLTRLRRVLAPLGGQNALVTVSDAIAVVDDAVRVDTLAFERALAESDSAALHRACDLYRGRFLDGFTIPEEPFDDWMTSERTRLHQLAIEAFTQRLTGLEAAGDVAGAIQAAIRLLDLDPLQEDIHRRLMNLYRINGQIGAALGQFDICARRLSQALGVQPSPATIDTYTQILNNRAGAELAAVHVPAGIMPERVTS